MDRHRRGSERQGVVSSAVPLLVFLAVFACVLAGLMLIRPTGGGSPGSVLRRHGLTRRRAVRKARKEYPILWEQLKGRGDEQD